MRRDALARDLHERLFAWMMLADERALVTTLVAGRTQYKRRTTIPVHRRHHEAATRTSSAAP